MDLFDRFVGVVQVGAIVGVAMPGIVDPVLDLVLHSMVEVGQGGGGRAEGWTLALDDVDDLDAPSQG